MKMLIMDKNPDTIAQIERSIRLFAPDSELFSFTTAASALDFTRSYRFDAAFINPEDDGLSLARQLRTLYSDLNVIFCSDDPGHMPDAFRMYASDYLMFPIDDRIVADSLEHLRFPRNTDFRKKRISVQCFGTFEVWCDGRPINFKHAKTKELFAYLIDRFGAGIDVDTLCGVLWEDRFDNVVKSYLRILIADLAKTLSDLDAGDVFIRKRNCYAINPHLVDCDLYIFAQGGIDALRLFKGEYMTQFSWSEYTLGELLRQRDIFELQAESEFSVCSVSPSATSDDSSRSARGSMA